MMTRFKALSARRENPIVPWIIGLASFAFFILFFFYAGPFLRGGLATIIASAPDAEYALLSKSALASRLKDAERELSHLRSQAMLYALLAEENRNLRSVLSAANPPTGVIARVLVRPPRVAYDTLLLDVGREEGVLLHNVVIFEGIALGTITTLDAHTCIVSLFSTPGLQTDVIIGEPRAVSVATGAGGGAFELSIPQGIRVSRGDIVRIPATESLAFGVVADVSSAPADVSQLVRVRTPVSLSDLDFVRVVPFAEAEASETP